MDERKFGRILETGMGLIMSGVLCVELFGNEDPGRTCHVYERYDRLGWRFCCSRCH